ncbi:MAG: 1-(5-phosphoribosyl)-5-[(5-phosphoribosylamino)methylideneamino]imidazole-4-carboxamide isomerase [Sinobacteraceae bacterium]|nr:1-(5-phosphoribosyl)-5-[(5-phosphoribosylamino)methylideneamino]imidazole-4-carboxamide isomerase [Nevskiaceae bacterium]
MWRAIPPRAFIHRGRTCIAKLPGVDVILIPSIDLRGGRCVRLLQGNFSAETVYDLDPAELAARYRALGATWLHVVDLDGARQGELGNRSQILQLANTSELRLQVGGGVRSEATVRTLLQGGVARVVVGSAALEDTAAVQQWFADFGSERVCLALDVRIDALGTPRVHTRGWTEATAVSLWEAIDRFALQGLRHVLCTDIARDGALAGPSIDLYAECLRRYPHIAWQASGGVRHHADLAQLSAVGMPAAVSGKALLEGRITESEARAWWVA